MSKFLLTDKYIAIELESPVSYWGTTIPYDTETISIPSVPAWITITNDAVAKVLTIEFAPTVAGSYGAYSFTAFNLYVEVTAQFFQTIDACCTGDYFNIGWFNRLGGWQNWTFDCKRIYQIDGSDAKTFVNDLTIKYNDVNDVYQAVEVVSDMLNRKHLDWIATLGYSIQAFLYNPTTTLFDIPILIDRKSVSKYDKGGLGEQMFPFPYSFRFIYSKKLLVQSQ